MFQYIATRVGKAVGLLAVLLAASTPLRAADFYVAPNAAANGTGTVGSPWRLQTALSHPTSVHPGDTIWLRGGTYVGHFTSTLAGTSAAPIIVRQYPGERATIDGNDGTNNVTVTIQGSYAWFWGFEVTNSSTNNRISSGTAPPPGRGQGTNLLGPNTKLINMVIHDTMQGVLTTANTNEVYGCLIYYNGYDGTDRGHGHGIYVQHDGTALKPIHDNVVFQQFGYGIHGYTEGGSLDNLDYQGNTVFDNGGLSHSSGWTTNILLGGLQVATNPNIQSNYTYNQVQSGKNNLGYSAGCTNPTVKDNYFASGTALKLVSCSGTTMTGNTFYGSLQGFTQAQFPSNTYFGSQPTGTRVFVRPNAYESGRAHLTVYNWNDAPTVNVDLSTVLAPGASYVIRNAQNYFGAPVLSGTYDGGAVAVPMTGLTAAAPVGLPTPAASGPTFNAFVLTSMPGPYEFFDVPLSNMFHDPIHTIAANGISAGCGNGNFCPNDPVTRAQMAVFLLKGKHGVLYAPPAATGTVFSDVSKTSFAAAWIEQLEAEGITTGCGGGRYCPSAGVTRAQMSVMLLRAQLGSAYAPPAASGTVFSDVPVGGFAAAWIEDLAGRGITAGCGGGKFCPSGINTRGQMAAFLVKTFSLQ